jgi:hypothetical protein
MLKVITIRCKGGSTEFEKRQMETMAKQEALQEQLSAIDKEFYDLRKQNQSQYDQQFRPMEEDLLKRAQQPAREATSARAREGDYDAADASSREALARRNERFGIGNSSEVADPEDDVIRSIALTAVGNVSKMSALETNKSLGQAALGIGTGVNQDIGQSYGRALTGMNQGLGHADAAFSNFSNAQQHENNAYAAKQQGYGALINTATSVAGMGISNYQNAQTNDALAGYGSSQRDYGGSWLSGSSKPAMFGPPTAQGGY